MALSDLQIQTLQREGVERAMAGDFEGAEPLLAQVADALPNSAAALQMLGQTRLKLGRFAEAREPLERSAKFLPRDAAAQVNAAGCLMMLGEYQAALIFLERAQRLNPNEAGIAHNHGRALEAVGRLDEAERAYDQALSIDHRLMAALFARANLLHKRGDWPGALADLDTALVSQPNNARLRLRRGEILLHQGDWMRGLADHEARLEIASDRYVPALPQWRGEPVTSRLLVYPEQIDISGDAAMRDTLMLARGLGAVGDAVVECCEQVADWLDMPTMRRGESLDGFAAAAPLRSLPHLLGWTLENLPPPAKARAAAKPTDLVGWFSRAEPPAGLAVLRDPAQVATCKLVVGEDTVPLHLAALMGIRSIALLGPSADWLWGPRSGPSPWYAHLEVLREDESEKLAERLGRC
jgi:tetratricopeptide (TPR) repeat protein